MLKGLNIRIYPNKKQTKVIEKTLLSLTSMLGNGTLGKPSFWESVSLSEDKIVEYYSKNPNYLREHSESGWLRSYPGGSRINSTNYNPMRTYVIIWAALEMGIQILALNTQTVDYPTCLLNRFFEKGNKGVIGYREKPLKPADVG